MLNVFRSLLTMLWPMLSRILSIWVFLQLIRAVYYWDDPSKNAGWTFAGYLLLLVGLTMIVSSGANRPRKALR